MNMLMSKKRKLKYLLLLISLCRRKTAKGSAAAAGMTPEEQAMTAPEYKKLYKSYGMNSGNKDVRKVLQDRLNSTTESPMSPNF